MTRVTRTPGAGRLAALLAAGLVVFGAGGGARAAEPIDLTPDAVTEKFGERRAYFDDWLAACRPDGYCSALTYQGARGDFYDYSVRVASPAPGADYAVLYTAVEEFLPQGAALSVTVDRLYDGRFEAMTDLGWGQEQGDAMNEHRFSQARANADLLPAMKRGYWMTVSWPTTAGETKTTVFSLRGLSAALVWIENNRF